MLSCALSRLKLSQRIHDAATVATRCRLYDSQVLEIPSFRIEGEILIAETVKQMFDYTANSPSKLTWAFFSSIFHFPSSSITSKTKQAQAIKESEGKRKM